MKVTLRQIQITLAERIRAAIAAGKTDIFVNAPPGTGKGLLALELAHDHDSYILTSEKSLQAQYEEDAIKYDIHNNAKSICGIDTYKCDLNGEKFSLGVCRMMGKSNQEALKMSCASTCQYLSRWVAAKEARRTIMNYSYALVQFNYVLEKMEAYAPFQKRELVICDEAHKLPDILEDHFACSVDKKFIERINSLLLLLRSTGNINHDLSPDDVRNAILKCLMLPKVAKIKLHLTALKELLITYQNLQNKGDALKEVFGKRFLSGTTDAKELKKKLRYLPKEVRATFSFCDSIKDRVCKLEDYIAIIENSSLENLIVDDAEEGVRAYHNLDDSYLFAKHFAKYSDIRIYMSATLQSNLLIKRFGINPEKALVLDVDSSWDQRRSPIVFCNTANLTYKNQEFGLKTCIKKIDELLKEHKGQRGIIHTTSNAIMNEIVESSKFKDRLYSYSGTEEKMALLESFGNYPKDAVLIGPSLTTGIDMHGDLARFNIIVKLSFPNMTSALWAKRYEVANHIYIGETASILEQACGRTTRSESDYSISYVLDSRAASFVQGNKSLFSSAFMKRIVKK